MAFKFFEHLFDLFIDAAIGILCSYAEFLVSISETSIVGLEFSSVLPLFRKKEIIQVFIRS